MEALDMAPKKERPGFRFSSRPAPEVERFIKNKGLKPAFDWRDVNAEEHAYIFTVATPARYLQTDPQGSG